MYLTTSPETGTQKIYHHDEVTKGHNVHNDVKLPPELPPSTEFPNPVSVYEFIVNH